MSDRLKARVLTTMKSETRRSWCKVLARTWRRSLRQRRMIVNSYENVANALAALLNCTDLSVAALSWKWCFQVPKRIQLRLPAKECYLEQCTWWHGGPTDRGGRAASLL